MGHRRKITSIGGGGGGRRKNLVTGGDRATF